MKQTSSVLWRIAFLAAFAAVIVFFSHSASADTSEVIVDDLNSGFTKYGTSSYWKEASIGYNNHMFWTYNGVSSVDNYAIWKPSLSGVGAETYTVYVYIPSNYANTTNAVYTIYHDGVTDTQYVNQAIYSNVWVTLGDFYFSASGNEYVKLVDATGESYAGSWIGFDAVKWVKKAPTNVTLTLYVHENNASGPIIIGARVAGKDAASNSFSQTTNPDGYVVITGVPGTWQFNASKSGYQSNIWSQSITITGTKHAYIVKEASPPTPTYPGSGSEPGLVINTLTPILQWNSVSNADYYALAISKYPYGSSNIVYNPQEVYGTSLTVPGNILVNGEKYRWNMQAHNSAGWSDVSNTLYFQVWNPSCVNGQTQPCTISGCAGTQTCSAGIWGNCVKTDNNCAITNEFVLDNNAVNYGSVGIGHMKIVAGDTLFSLNDGKMTVRNLGNTYIDVMLNQTDMGFGYHMEGANKVWNVEFCAKIGNEAAFTCYNPYETFKFSLSPNQIESIDFAIQVRKAISTGNYSPLSH